VLYIRITGIVLHYNSSAMEKNGGVHVMNGFDITFLVLLVLSLAIVFRMLLKPKGYNNTSNANTNKKKM
jgi:hypothetical protein